MRHGDDFVVWPDGTSCDWSEIEQMSHMSDDYIVIPVDTPAWYQMLIEQEREMNVAPGDLAKITKSMLLENIGKHVRVHNFIGRNEFLGIDDAWQVEMIDGTAMTRFGFKARFGTVSDANLERIEEGPLKLVSFE